MFPKLSLKIKKFPTELNQTYVKLQKMTKHLWRFSFTAKCVSVSRGQFLFPVLMLMALLMSLLFLGNYSRDQNLCL